MEEEEGDGGCIKDIFCSALGTGTQSPSTACVWACRMAAMISWVVLSNSYTKLVSEITCYGGTIEKGVHR